MSIELWNLLHDGSITGAAWTRQAELTLTVGIEYLREMFAEPGTAFTIVLRGTSRFAYHDYTDEIWLDDPAKIAGAEPEILSATADDSSLAIICVKGELRLRYKHFTLALDTGTPLTIAELDDAARRYWDAWGKAK